MAINPEHIPLYEEAFAYLRQVLPADAVALIIGYQEILPNSQYRFPFITIQGLFESWGWYADTIDKHEPKATFQNDLNVVLYPIRDRDLVFDIGTLEHIADSQRALENYLFNLKTGGRIFLLTPCKGYFNHGLHTFSPEYITETLMQNGCRIEKLWFMLPEWKGGAIRNYLNSKDFENDEDLLMVVIAQLIKPFERPIKAIQQKRWIKN